MLSKLLLLSLGLFPGLVYAQSNDPVEKFHSFIQHATDFNYYFPQEKVFLHLDNSAYFIGDTLWFKAYVVTVDSNRSNPLSKVLYVDMLSPEGNVVDTRKLKVTDGQCHGEFPLNRLLMFSGFYEIRAYTRYMMNFGEATAFSRVFPLYDTPETTGNYQPKTSGPKHPLPKLRELPEKNRKANISFFPEGGHLVNGLDSRIAFQVTDRHGLPAEAQGYILDSKKDTVCRFATVHRGTGAFHLTPGTEKYTAGFVCDGKNYTAELPTCLPGGFTLETDNTRTDSIGFHIRKSGKQEDEIVALVVQCRGQIYACNIIRMPEPAECSIRIPTRQFPTGVIQVSLINAQGKVLADRLSFINHRDQLTIKYAGNRERLVPFGYISSTFRVSGSEGQPVATTLSVAIRDAGTEMPGATGNNILTELLLSSDIKGYIHRPDYYFEADDPARREALDLLMLTQGWRRYDLPGMAGVTPLNLSHAPEKGIVIDGSITPLYAFRPLKNVEISVILEKDMAESLIGKAYTDSLGHFYVSQELEGDWKAVIQTSLKGKNRNYDIRLHRDFPPSPRALSYAETHPEGNGTASAQPDSIPTGYDRQDSLYSVMAQSRYDSLREAFRNTHLLATATVKGKKTTTETEDNLKSADIIYDTQQEMDDILDKGGYISHKNVQNFLSEINKNFIYWNNGIDDGYEKDPGYVFNVRYKNKRVLFVFNDKIVEDWELNILEITDIQNIAISESPGLIAKYAPNPTTSHRYGCIVLLYGDWKPAKSRGIRITKIKGYSPVAEYYHADKSNALPFDTDYRRTLYWNPCLRTDSSGRATVNFYNNSSCTRLRISAATISPDGKIGYLEY